MIKKEELIKKARLYLKKILDFYAKIDFKYKDLTVIIVVALLVIVFDYSLVLSRQMRLLGSLNKKATEYRQKLSLADDSTSRVESFQTRRRSLKEKAEQFTKEIITETQISGLIEDIEQCAKDEFVKVSYIKPMNLVRSLKSTSSEYTFSTLGMHIEAVAGYHQFGKFINRLERLNSFITVKELNIKASATSNLRHNIKFLLNIFVKIPK
ncbi:MAG: type 4a pilus biogenesis protein PilO [Candidatus Gygaella obscura]|nr:type 4a pilus biogenesis protein PilO [Candidatus Gygaella obscura]